MSYSNFKTIDEVIDRFRIEVKSAPFFDSRTLEIDNYPFLKIEKNIHDDMYY